MQEKQQQQQLQQEQPNRLLLCYTNNLLLKYNEMSNIVWIEAYKTKFFFSNEL